MRERSDWFAPPLPRLIAHRGLAVDEDGAPVVAENTLGAFRRALDVGATHLETDARATADGVAVLWHDPDLARVGGVLTPMARLDLEALRGIPLAGGQRVCTVEEALAAFPDARFNIDIKSADAVLPTAKAIRAAGAEQRVLIASFSRARRVATLGALRGDAPVATSASSAALTAAVLGARLGIRPLVDRMLARVDAVQLPPESHGLSTSTPAAIRRFHDAGVEVHYWTINEPVDMRRLVGAGADAIITDRVDLAMRELRG